MKVGREAISEWPDDELVEESRDRGALEVERESSQGVELFEDPDAVLRASELREGAPGHEVLTANGVGLERNADEDHREVGGDE